VKSGRRGVAHWLVAGGLCAGCLHVDAISLGAFERDASKSEPPPNAGPGDSCWPPPIAPNDGEELGREEEDEEQPPLLRDAGSLSVLDAAAPVDAGTLDASQDAGPADAGADGGRDAGSLDASRDGGREGDSGALDAGNDPPVNPLCIIEPWHCL